MDALDDKTSKLQWESKDKFCHVEQVAIMTCMQEMNSSKEGGEKAKSSNECYLPSITAWNECVAKGVGYL